MDDTTRSQYEIAEEEIDRLLGIRLIVSRGGLISGALRLELDAL